MRKTDGQGDPEKRTKTDRQIARKRDGHRQERQAYRVRQTDKV